MATVVVLDGSRPAEQGMEGICRLLTDVLHATSVREETLCLRELEIAACQGCFACWTRTPGECVIDDAARGVARAVIGGDVTVLLTPIVFGGVSSDLKKAVDRLIPLYSPLFRRVRGEVHHRPRYSRYPSLVGIGVTDRGLGTNDEQVFRRLFDRIAVNFMSPSHGVAILDAADAHEQMAQAIREVLAGVGVS